MPEQGPDKQKHEYDYEQIGQKVSDPSCTILGVVMKHRPPLLPFFLFVGHHPTSVFGIAFYSHPYRSVSPMHWTVKGLIEEDWRPQLSGLVDAVGLE